MIEQLLAFLFPPRMPKGIIEREMVSWQGGDIPEVLGDGIVWRGWDIRLSGIERERLREEGRV